MLKYLTLALLLEATTGPVLAQTAAVSAATTEHYQYCQLVSLGTRGLDAYLEYGQHAKPAAANPELDALNEQIKKLDSVILGLNYMTSHGWEYVGVTSLSPGVATYIIYVLRRRTQ